MSLFARVCFAPESRLFWRQRGESEMCQLQTSGFEFPIIMNSVDLGFRGSEREQGEYAETAFYNHGSGRCRLFHQNARR
jgi:hypothetical protein